MTVRSTVGRRTALVLAGAVLVGCTSATADDADRLLATPSPVPSAPPTSPSDGSDVPSTPSPPTPSATASPSSTPSPSPAATPSPSPPPPPPSVLPSEDEALAAAVARRAERPECGEGGLADDLHSVVDAHDGALLVHVVCFLGAYQANGELLAYDGELTAWPVQQWLDGQLIDSVEVVGGIEVVSDGVLENVQSYRGLGDCGLLQRWEVDDRRLVLLEAREQQCDDGAAPAPPSAWPVVYSA